MRRLRIVVATPARRGARQGNRVTALRWAAHLRALGHAVAVVEAWDGRPCDLLVALHATKSAPSVERWRAARGDAPAVVGMAGTDLYGDLPASPVARRAVELATRVTVLQPLGIAALPASAREKARVIFQSARPAPPEPAPPGVLRACVMAHLRAVKDPFLGAEAARLLPAGSRIRIAHLGAALDEASAARARAATAAGGRWTWLGERRRRSALAFLAGSALLVVTSRSEGGSNALSEAIAAGVPVLSTRVDGTVGVLGEAYPGYFPVGDAAALAALLQRADADPAFLASLRDATVRARQLVDPGREREAWRALLDEVAA